MVAIFIISSGLYYFYHTPSVCGGTPGRTPSIPETDQGQIGQSIQAELLYTNPTHYFQDPKGGDYFDG